MLLSVLFLTIMFLTKFIFFFFNDTATTEIYTLSLHDALPIYRKRFLSQLPQRANKSQTDRKRFLSHRPNLGVASARSHRSEEHTSELQSLAYLVCRLLLEKKKKKRRRYRAAPRRRS